MRNFYIPLSLVVFFSSYVPAYASPKALPTVEIMGKRYYVYVAKKGDTLFGIARDQKWNDAELQRLNSKVTFPLKKGTKLYYPIYSTDHSDKKELSLSSYPVTELTHVVAKGESVYSIARLYNLPVEEIYENNPESRNGIKTGQVLSLVKNNNASNSLHEAVNPNFHTIERSESLGDIAKKYDVSVASLMATNPGVLPRDIKEGITLKIPEKGTGLEEVTKDVEIPVLENFDLYKVQKDDNWETISVKTGVDTKILSEANPDVKTLKKNQNLTIPRISNVNESQTMFERDSRESTDTGIKSIYNDVHKVTAPTSNSVEVKVAILAENPSSKKDTEFIRGFLTGIDKIKGQENKINIKVIDGNNSGEVVTKQINDFGPNIVFYTGDKNLPDFLLNFAESSLTPIVNTFDVKSEDYLHNPYIIQLLTPSTLFNETVASNAYEKFGDHKLIIVGQEDESDQLAPELKKLWNPKRVKYCPTGQIDINALPDNDKYIFYSYSIKKQEVEELLKSIGEFKESSPFTDIVTFGRPNWVLYDSQLSDELHKANTFIPSRFYLDDNTSEVKNFNASYRNLFNRTPAKSVPLYAGVGYDLATYFIPAMASSSNDLNILKPSHQTLQSEINLRRVSNWSGFINPPVYLVNFTPYNTIDKIVIE